MRPLRPLALALALMAPTSVFASTPASKMLTVEPGVQIHVLQAGAGSRTPLVLVPGWTMPASIWSGQIARFSTERPVVAIDPRSQGESTKTAQGDTPDVRARDLKSVLDQLGAQKIVLVGWSQGVQDVAAFVNQFGTSRLAGVVLVDSAISDGAAGLPKRAEAASQQLRFLDIYARAPEDYLRGMLDAIIITPQGKARIDELAAQGLKTPPAIGVAMLIADLFGADRTGAIARLDVPVLIVTSPRALDLDGQNAMAAAIKGSTQVVIDNSGHAVFVDQPEKFDAALADFLKRLG